MASSESFIFTVDSFVLENSDRIRTSAKRYTPQLPDGGLNMPKGVQIIVLFAHALGFHKEHWEPVIKELFQEDHAAGSTIIKEAWAIDCPDHGESAILNENELENRKRYISCYEYGDVFIRLIRSGLLDGGLKLIFVGHSAGAISGILSTARYHQSGTNPYDSMVLIEPAIISKNLLANDLAMQKVVAQLSRSSGSRRDIWPSIADAKSWMAQKSPWKSWDSRILDIYVQFGMRPLPTRIYPNTQTGVTLSFPRLTHSLAYNNLQDQHDALDQLKVICLTSQKVHVIFGRRIDYNPKAVQDEIASIVRGSTIGTVSYIKDVGHMIIQEDPAQVAKVLCGILRRNYGSVGSKL